MSLLSGILDTLRGTRGVVKAPTLGLLNLQGAEAAPLLEEDRAALAPIFYPRVTLSDGAVPRCDVLFVYARVEPEGELAGVQGGMRALVSDSGAKVTVFAMDDPGDHYTAGWGEGSGGPPTNLVMTLRRNGRAFPAFFSQLFRMMMDGEAMPMAWHRLAPQIPGASGANQPELVGVMGLGGLRFSR